MSLRNPRTSDPVSLACELEGLVPVERLEEGDAAPSGGSPSAARRLVSHSDSFREQKQQAVAPYQALPVQGPVVKITEHLTPALNVVEPRKGENAEVSKRSFIRARIYCPVKPLRPAHQSDSKACRAQQLHLRCRWSASVFSILRSQWQAP